MVGEITMIDRAAEKIRAPLAGAKEEHGLRIAKLAQLPIEMTYFGSGI